MNKKSHQAKSKDVSSPLTGRRQASVVKEVSVKPGVAPAAANGRMDIATLRNRELQLNHNNVRYWSSRGHESRPDNWKNSEMEKKAKGS